MWVVLGIVFAAFLHPVDGAELVRHDGVPYVHVYSTDWYVTGADPAVRTNDLNQVALSRPGQQLEVCVRSYHYRAGTIWISWPKLITAITFPHDRGRLATRCGVGTVVAHPGWLAHAGPLEVREGTYIHQTGGHVVHGLIRKVLVRDAPDVVATP